MVKANFSFGGKLLLVLVTVIIYTFVLIGGIIGGALYAYNNVKVGELLDLIGQTQLVSKEYAEKTIQQFVADIQKELSGDGLTLQKIIDISPQAGDMINDVLDNVDQNGIITIDRDTLFGTPVQELAASLMDIAVVSATLGSLQDTMGVTLPDMPVIAGGAEGSEVWLYSAANQNEEQTLDKAFLYGDYTYYTKAEQFSEEPVATPETVSLYSLPNVDEDEDGSLRSDGRLIYRKVADGRYEKLLTSSSYVRKTENGYLFATDELYRKGDLGSAADSYVRLTSTPAGEEKETPVPMKYRYQPLYLEDGNLATEGPNAETGQYTVIGDYQGESLYAMEDVYTEVAAENLENGVPKDDFLQENIVYVKSNGLTALPVLNAVNALSAVFDMETLTLRMAGEYFGVDLEVEMLDDVLDVPLAYIGSSVDETVQNIELGTALGLDGDSDPLLLFLAYGEEGIDYTINSDNEIDPINPPKTIANVTDSIDTITIGNLIGVEEDSADILIAIQDWTLADFRSKDKIESLTLDDILGIDENDDSTAAILKALKDVPIGKLETTIETLSLQEMLGEEITPENNILWALKDCTLGNMATVVSTLSLQDLFADEIYGENYSEVDPADYIDETNTFSKTHLYVKNGDSYTLATEVIRWALPTGADPKLTYYKLIQGGDTPRYEQATADVEGLYDVSELYYLDSNDETATVELVPARIGFIGGYDEKETYYSLYSIAQTATKEIGGVSRTYYINANLYYFDVATESFVRITALTPVEENGTIIGYQPENAASYSAIYTRGEVTEKWKYLLTNSNKTEIIANINDVGSLLDNITSNINNRSLGEMYADGILHLEDESILDTEIPDILLDETDRPEEGETRPTLRNQTVTSLLGFTSKALEILNEFETSPIKAFQKYFPDAYDDLFPTNP